MWERECVCTSVIILKFLIKCLLELADAHKFVAILLITERKRRSESYPTNRFLHTKCEFTFEYALHTCVVMCPCLFREAKNVRATVKLICLLNPTWFISQHSKLSEWSVVVTYPFFPLILCVVAKCLCELIHILNVRIVLNSKGDQFAFFLFMMPIFLQNTQNSQCSFLAQVSVHVRGIVMRHTPDIPEKFHKIKWNACTISLHFSISISFPFGYKEILANRIQFVIFRQQIEHTTFLRRDRRKFWKLKGK